MGTLDLGPSKTSTCKSMIFEDYNACVSMAKSPKMSPRMKHIAIKCHFFKLHIDGDEISIEKIDTTVQKADMFTKGLLADTL